jgi:uncharacterized phage-associated protein
LSTVFDVAQYILKRYGSLEAMKLQKLVFYSQAWRVVQSGLPLFDEPIKAWKMGPVVGTLWYRHKGWRHVTPEHIGSGQADVLSDDEATLIDSVMDFYGRLSGDELSELTHDERPWVDAYARPEYDRKIHVDALKAFYAEQLVYHATAVPAIPVMATTYVASEALCSILGDIDIPDDVSSLVTMIRSAQATIGS